MAAYEVGCTNFWDFNVGLNDLIGSNNLTNHGAIENTASSGAKYYTFDGESAYMAGSAPISLDSTFSIEFIARINVTQSPYIPAAVFSDMSDSGDFWGVNFYTPWPPHTNLFNFYERNTYAREDFGIFNFPYCNAAHFVITSDGSTVTLYVNGVVVSSQSQRQPAVSPIVPFVIGGMVTSDYSEAFGAFDAYLLRIFPNTALTQSQVTENFGAENWRLASVSSASLTTQGWAAIASALIADGAVSLLDDAVIGVGNSDTTVNTSQTALQGSFTATAPMNEGFPSRNNSVITLQATFSADEANFPWCEMGLFNADGQMLYRQVFPFLVKDAGTGEITFTKQLTINTAAVTVTEDSISGEWENERTAI